LRGHPSRPPHQHHEYHGQQSAHPHDTPFLYAPLLETRKRSRRTAVHA
jgi:hypothetical protein